jgi:hypothetical protein
MTGNQTPANQRGRRYDGVAIYSRTASCPTALRRQRDVCEHFCARHGWSVVKVYEDTGRGRDPGLPGLAQLRLDAACGQFDAIVVERLDRLGRSPQRVIDLLHEWDRIEVSAILVNEGLDTSYPGAAKAVIGMLLTRPSPWECDQAHAAKTHREAIEWRRRRGSWPEPSHKSVDAD